MSNVKVLLVVIAEVRTIFIIKTAALFNFAFGVFHLFFWRILNWKEQLTRLSPVNSAVFQTLNICLTFTFVLVASIFYLYTDEVRSTEIGNALMLGTSLFWLVRAFAQVYFFNIKERVHKILLTLFIFGFVLHLTPLIF